MGDVQAAGHRADSGLHSGEVGVVTGVQGFGFGDGGVHGCVIRRPVLQRGDGVLDGLGHGVHLGLMGDVQAAGHRADGGLHGGEVGVVFRVQGLRLGDGSVHGGVVRRPVFQRGDGILDGLGHGVDFCLFGFALVTIHCFNSSCNDVII